MVRKLLGLMIVICMMADIAHGDTLTVSNLAASNATATISAPSMGTVTFVVSGTFSATLTPKCSVDGITYQTATVTGPYPSTSTSTSITSAGTYQFPAAGWSYVQLVATSYTSGTATVKEYASTALLGAGSSGGAGAVTQSGTWTVQPGNTANTTAWLFNLGSSQLTTLTPPSNTGYALDATLQSILTDVANIPAQGQALAAGATPVVLTAAQLAALTPPTNAGYATAAKQPALGTAGTPATDVLSMQGVAGGTPVPISISSSDLSVGPTSVTSATQVVAVATSGYYGVGVNVTSAGSTCTQVAEFSMDGGTTWTIAQLYNANTQTLSLSTTTTGQYGIVVPAGTSNVRMRVSVYGSGTVTDQLRATGFDTLVRAAQIVAPIPAGTNLIGSTGINDGTTAANVAPASGSQTGQGAVQVAATWQDPTFSFGSATTGTSYDVGSYRGISVEFTGNASANTIAFQCSNDNTNWDTVSSIKAQNPGTSGSVSTTFSSSAVPQVWLCPIYYRYFRLNCTSFVSGTTTGTMHFSTMPSQPLSSIVAAQVGTWTVQPGNTPNTSAWLVQQSAAAVGGYSFLNIAALTAGTTVKSGAGTLHSITINTKGASADTLKLYDNTAASGTVIGTWDTVAPAGATYILDLQFSTGLEAVVATGTTADITITYK